MKAIKIWVFGGIFLALSLLGCHPTKRVSVQALNAWMQPSAQLKVLSTTAMIDDLVAAIGQEHILHQPLIRGQLDPHSYELVKGDSEKIICADVIFYNGLELEHGASLKYQLTHQSKAYSLGDVLASTKSSELIFWEGQVDPHIWMDVRLFSCVVDPIVRVLSEKDPAHAEVFAKNGAALKQEMLVLDQEIYEAMQKIPQEVRYLITSHDAFFYFAKRYLAEQGEEDWQERFAAPEGLAPDGQISPQDIQQIIDYALLHQVKWVFPESNLNRDALKKIVTILRNKGREIAFSEESLYGDTLGDTASEAGSYLGMMRYNTRHIAAHLQGEKK
ncbi:MAG: ABC transporter substrate-binding protein [Chlamydiae bacterium]|nr:ABC transporter substrate-binding protein [Chlamydiota bacterium]